MSSADILKRILEEARREVNDWPDTMKSQESSHRLSSQQSDVEKDEDAEEDRPLAKCG